MRFRLGLLLASVVLVGSVTQSFRCFAGANAEMDCCKTFDYATVSAPFQKCCSELQISHSPMMPEALIKLHSPHFDSRVWMILATNSFSQKDFFNFARANPTHWGGFYKQSFHIQSANLLL